jgi:AbrB family looped-hinge helix DNA binding protein
MVAIAKITSKGQTTIPQEIRESMHVQAGDTLLWKVEADGSAHVRRIQPLDLDYLSALQTTLPEWGSAADEEAYRDL